MCPFLTSESPAKFYPFIIYLAKINENDCVIENQTLLNNNNVYSIVSFLWSNGQILLSGDSYAYIYIHINDADVIPINESFSYSTLVYRSGEGIFALFNLFIFTTELTFIF